MIQQLGTNNKLHIFWFVIDSVRTFRSGKDDRDRLAVMDDLALDSVEFTNCLTSAPSSLLAAAGMFTGLPSTFVARHFNDFKIGIGALDTIASLVKIHGYRSFPILDTRDIRIPLNHVLPSFGKKYLPNGYKLSDYAWHNWDLNRVFRSILDKYDFSNPACFTFWFDCRRDPKTSDYVRECIDWIKEEGLYEDAIVVMHSDHGYPDPDSQLNEAYFKELGHDMVLTDDNIRVPFFLKYPGCPKSNKIKDVCGLIDIIPTLFDILKLPYKVVQPRYQGMSLLPLIRGEEKESRIRISDTRLPMDVNRISAYRSTIRKYIYFHESRAEFFFDLENDPSELKNLGESVACQTELNQFRVVRDDFEREIYLFHRDNLERNARKSFQKMKKWFPRGLKKVVIVSKGIKPIISLLAEKTARYFDGCLIDLVYSGTELAGIKNVSGCFQVKDFTYEEIVHAELGRYDLVVFLTENSSRVFLKEEIRRGIKSIPARKHVLMNFNFELFNYFVYRFLHSNKLKMFLDWDNKGFLYKQEPFFLIKDVVFFLIWAVKKVYKTHFTKEKDVDLKAAKDIMDFRKFHLEGNESGLIEMDDQLMKYEYTRIRTRDS
ncbi:MAG: hypothetical protein EHM45_02850 [Desulfobacteraceae bacterium]|nr:MAG: hypothetical protein EHM45_02850 [Desulfobacteraceae bacterium]